MKIVKIGGDKLKDVKHGQVILAKDWSGEGAFVAIRIKDGLYKLGVSDSEDCWTNCFNIDSYLLKQENLIIEILPPGTLLELTL